MPEITAKVETAMLGWFHGEIVTVEQTDFTDLLVHEGRLTIVDVAAPENTEDTGDVADPADDKLAAGGAGKTL